MSDEFSINDFLESVKHFHDIRNEDEYARYRSWEHCNKVFNKKHTELIEKRKNGSDLSEEDYDFLALHLSFYLASWGMYRGSSMLLSTDYKIHIPIVKELMKEKYDNLWNITYKDLNNEKNNIVGLIKEIKELYGDRPAIVQMIYKDKIVEKPPEISDILVTKILLGTLACMPAYDTYFKETIKKYKRGISTPNAKSIEALAEFYADNEEALNNLLVEFENDVEYPQMKLLDMGFFQYGMDKASD